MYFHVFHVYGVCISYVFLIFLAVSLLSAAGLSSLGCILMFCVCVSYLILLCLGVDYLQLLACLKILHVAGC